MENLQGTQSSEKPNAVQLKLPVHSQATTSTDNGIIVMYSIRIYESFIATIVSKKEATTKVHVTHQYSGLCNKYGYKLSMCSCGLQETLIT